MSADSAGRNWCWSEDADDIVVKAQPAVAVYAGPAGVFIRRQGDLWCGDDDGVIWFSVDQAPTIAAAILAAAGLNIVDLVPEPAEAGSKASDKTAAGRQRRYRQRRKKEPQSEPDLLDRNACDGRDVTERNGVTPEDRNGAD